MSSSCQPKHCFVPELPKNHYGKVLKTSLRDMQTQADRPHDSDNLHQLRPGHRATQVSAWPSPSGWRRPVRPGNPHGIEDAAAGTEVARALAARHGVQAAYVQADLERDAAVLVEGATVALRAPFW